MITCTANGKKYIGHSNNMRKRLNEHRRNLEKVKHNNPIIQNSYNKYGRDSFLIDVIEIVLDNKDLIKREDYWSKHFDSFNSKKGCNICPITHDELNRGSSAHGDKVKGEKNGKSKLSKEDVKEICKLINQKELTMTEIGQVYGLTYNGISSIRKGRTWSDVSKDYISEEIINEYWEIKP